MFWHCAPFWPDALDLSPDAGSYQVRQCQRITIKAGFITRNDAVGEIKQTGYFKNDATERSYGPSYNYKSGQSGSGAVRGAIPGDMSFGSTRIAGPLLRLSTVPANVTYTTAVVTLGTLNTVPRHMAYATTGVASLCATTKGTSITRGSSGIRASASDMASLAAAVALSSGGTGARAGVGCGAGWAVARDMAL